MIVIVGILNKQVAVIAADSAPIMNLVIDPPCLSLKSLFVIPPFN